MCIFPFYEKHFDCYLRTVIIIQKRCSCFVKSMQCLGFPDENNTVYANNRVLNRCSIEISETFDFRVLRNVCFQYLASKMFAKYIR